MKYIQTPKEVKLKELLEKKSLSPSMYNQIHCPNPNTIKVKDLIFPLQKGKEVGSSAYVEESKKKFIRTSSLQNHSFLLVSDSKSPISINPQSFQQHGLELGDILYSKDADPGKCCILESNNYKDHMMSAGILKIKPKKQEFYIFAFLKHFFVKSQLENMTGRGSTIKHSKENVLLCKIPFPSGPDKQKIINNVENITKRIIEIEELIQNKDTKIIEIINEELEQNPKKNQFVYEEPRISKIFKIRRLDAGMYCKEFGEKSFLIINYKHGYNELTDKSLNFEERPGPSLELKIIKTRIDSEESKPDFYTLLIPTDISDFGTMEKIRYMGTTKNLEELEYGDILLGESGTWRSMVLLSKYPRCITNAHGSRLRQMDKNFDLAIFVRCILSWYKKTGLFSLMAVGGSGGHLSPSYFDRILIPKFPDTIIKKIVNLYHGEGQGISELNDERLKLIKKLDVEINNIINEK